MKWIRNNPTGYLGLLREQRHAHLAAVKTDGDELVIVSTVSGDGGLASLVERLDEDVRGWPIVRVLPTQAGLHRELDLPESDDDATRKMLALRLEAIYPLQETALQWGWQRDGGRVWVYLAAPPADAAPDESSALGGVVSQEMALVAQVLRRDPRATLTIVTGEGEHAAVTVLVNGHLHGVAQADLDGGEAAQLAALDEALEQIESPQRPARLLVTGPASPLTATLAERWRMQRVTVAEALGESDLSAAIAAGAAIALLRRSTPVIVFQRDATVSPEDRRRTRRRVFQAAGWLAAAVAALVAVDLRNASLLDREQIDSLMDPRERAELEQQRVLGNYVQSLGPTPLAILDEIGSRTRNIQLDDVTYDAGGEFRLRGKLRSTETVNELLNALSKMQTLDRVSLVSQRSSGRDEVEFEITARANRMFLAAFATPPAEPAGSGARQANRGDGPPGRSAPAREAAP